MKDKCKKCEAKDICPFKDENPITNKKITIIEASYGVDIELVGEAPKGTSKGEVQEALIEWGIKSLQSQSTKFKEFLESEGVEKIEKVKVGNTNEIKPVIVLDQTCGKLLL